MLLYKLIIAFILDILFGDPAWIYHPIRLIGKLISVSERILRKWFPKTREGEMSAGLCMFMVVICLCWLLPYLALSGLEMIAPKLGFVIEVIWMWQILAMRCLAVESKKVYTAIKSKDLGLARTMISYLVGRDTQSLSFNEIIKATVETVAENTSDGVIAPMLFMAIGGAPLGFLYKGVNTMDSMVGYKNEKYINFGYFPAKMDDIFNFIPARVSGLLMIVAAFLCGYDGKGAVRIFFRDRNNHLSPNSAQTESACAGALGIQLGGTHDYFGKPVVKPTIGDDINEPEAEHILDTHRLMYMTAILCMFLVNIICAVIYFVI